MTATRIGTSLLAVLVLAAGCEPAPPGTGGFTATAVTQSGDFRRPLDTVPSSDGATFYFTAQTATGTPGVFQVSGTGGAVSAIATGAPFTSPRGIAISSDDRTLYITDDDGVYALPVIGGSPTLLAGTGGTRPRGLDVVSGSSGDTLYFSCTESGLPGLCRIGASGGSLTVVAQGSPFVDPGGVVVAPNGDAYVVNSSANESGGNLTKILRVRSNVTAVFVPVIRVGSPSGLALNLAGTILFVSSHDTNGRDQVVAIDLATGAESSYSRGIAENTTAGGVHRARGVDVFSWPI